METFKAIINRKGIRDFNQQPVSKAQLVVADSVIRIAT